MLATVANFTEPWEAHMFCLRLEAEGIPAIVTHEHHVTINWAYALALGGAKVQVFHFDRDLARSIERRCLAGDFRTELCDEWGDLDDDKCPRCQSLSFMTRPAWTDVSMVLSAVIAAGVIFPLRKSIFHCAACGSRWQDDSLSRRFPSRFIAGIMLVASAIGILSWDHLL